MSVPKVDESTDPLVPPVDFKPLAGAEPRGRLARFGLPAAAAVVWLLLPLLVQGDYERNVIVAVAIFAFPILALMMLFGFAGQVSIGHAAFMGVGAYAVGYANTGWGWPWWLGVLLGMALSAGVAWPLGFAILRLRGYYLAMATSAVGVIGFSLFRESGSITGGFTGLGGIDRPSVFGLRIASTLAYYYAYTGLALVVVVLLRHLARGDYGRRLRTIRESDVAAQAFGINIRALKAQVFALSAGLAALGGSLYALYVTFVSPETFSVHQSLRLLLATVVGGLGAVWGAAVGAVYLVVLPEVLSQQYGQYDIAISGVIVVLLLRFFPGGIVEIIGIVGRRLRRAPRPDVDAAPEPVGPEEAPR